MYLTVADLKARIEGLPGDAPVRFDVELRYPNRGFVPCSYLRGVYTSGNPARGEPVRMLIFHIDTNF